MNVATVFGPFGPAPSITRPLIGDPPVDTVNVVPLTVVALIGSLNCTVTSLFVATSALPADGITCVTVGGVASPPAPVENVTAVALSSGMPAGFLMPTVIATVKVPEGAKGTVGVNRTSVFGPLSVVMNEYAPGIALPLFTLNVLGVTVAGSRLWLNSASIVAFVPTPLCVWAGERARTTGCGPVKPVVPLRVNWFACPSTVAICFTMLPLPSISAT